MTTSKLSFKKRKNSKDAKLIAGVVIVAIVIIIFVAVNMSAPVNSFLKELRIESATVVEKGIDDNSNYFIRLSLPPDIYILSDNQWVQVDANFYNSHSTGSTVGVLLGNYDIFKKNPWGKGQKFQKNLWSIDDVYESLDAAQKANPRKVYTAKAKVLKKKTNKDGTKYFVLDADNRTINAPVDEELYVKYDVSQEVNCEFTSIGDSVKFNTIIK